MGQRIHIQETYRRKRTGAQLKVALLIAALVAVVAAVVLVITGLPTLKGQPEYQLVSGSTTTVAAVTTTTTTVDTTAAVTGESVTTTSTTAALSTGQTGAGGLLQYDTTGHYVQADSYADTSIPWNLRLVNDWNVMPADYEAKVDFINVGNNQRVDSRINADLQAMFQAGAAYGIGVQSGYRTAELQGTLYWRQVNRQKAAGLDDIAAQTAAGKIVKRPGYSEHNTGLAVDLGGSGNFSLEQSFENTAAFKWLMEHCAEYGFILRFPKGKEDITGVIYEPWHYRYVGKEVATEIMDRGLCLEEYLEQQKK